MPTIRGWAVAAAAAGCYLAGWLLGYPGLAVLGVGAAAAFGAAWLQVARPAPLQVHREVRPLRVGRGDPALAVLTCRQPGRRRLAPVAVADLAGAEAIAVPLPPLPAGGSHTTSYPLPTRRRGQVSVGPLRVRWTDPLGLVRRERGSGDRLTLYVRPKTVPLVALPSGQVASTEGLRSERAAGGTVTFHSLRPYVFGDDLRHIHWRTSARANTLLVRQLVDTSLPRTLLLLDTRAGAYGAGDDFELAVDIAASVAVAAAGRGFPVSVLAGACHLSCVDGRPGQAAALLDQLAGVGMAPDAGTGPADLPAALAAIRPGRGRGALVVVTGGGRPDELRLVAAARDGYDRTVVVRAGARLPSLPASLPIVVIDAPDLDRFVVAWQRRVNG